MKALLGAASVGLLLTTGPVWAQTMARNPQQLNGQDQNFIRAAEDGNFSEVTLGKLAEQRADSKAVKAFGRKMGMQHTEANGKLLRIAQQAGYDGQPQLTDKAKQLQQQLQGASGPQFDQIYMNAMVDDHKDDLPAFRDEAQSGQNPKIKAFARQGVQMVDQNLKMAESIDGKLAANGSKGYGASQPREPLNRQR